MCRKNLSEWTRNEKLFEENGIQKEKIKEKEREEREKIDNNNKTTRNARLQQ